jgi:hypothetical protein
MSVTRDEKISYVLVFIMFCVIVAGAYSVYCVSDAEHVRSAHYAFNMVRMFYGHHTSIA